VQKDEPRPIVPDADALSIPAGRPSPAEVLIEDVRRGLAQDPRAAHAAALRLAALLTLSAEPAGGLAPWRKRKVDRYLRRHLDRPLRTKDLARQAGLSVSHFCRAFRSSFGTTPRLYLIQLRLEQARRLMLATDEPLSQIALACGLSSQAHLSKLFRRWLGETPSAWRRQNRRGP
jgi:AraC-like DNA-binding protein